MLPFRTVLQSICSSFLVIFLAKSVVDAAPVGDGDNTIVHWVNPSFISPQDLNQEAQTLREHLQYLGDSSSRVYPLHIMVDDHNLASERVRQWLDDEAHIRSLLRLGSEGTTHKYAFLLPETPEAHELVGSGVPRSARMGMISVYFNPRNLQSTILLNGFFGLENVDRNVLIHRIITGWDTHDMSSLLAGRIHGF
ncbi:uncharacterized protein UTRI_06228 [Ustilago trichophora]|uniref:Uncharacterized protein n=1 Tax=Ustilago trichophora TaxID=86804 RepID=A0A5C3EJ70_9BASI|nr:uncharacterized protein UTRI_06228 [Ustilago trichophora]